MERELGEFVVEGVCPRCGRELELGLKAHLQACGGAKAPRQPRASDAEELEVRLAVAAGCCTWLAAAGVERLVAWVLLLLGCGCGCRELLCDCRCRRLWPAPS